MLQGPGSQNAFKVKVEVVAIVASKHLREVNADKPRGITNMLWLKVLS